MREETKRKDSDRAVLHLGFYLTPLALESSPLLRLLDNVAQLLIGQLQVPRQEVVSLPGTEALKGVQHAAVVMESGRRRGKEVKE